MAEEKTELEKWFKGFVIRSIWDLFGFNKTKNQTRR